MNFYSGFACSTFLWLCFFGWMYLRARRRVNSIKAAIENSKKAKVVVEEALNRVYSPRK